MSKSTNPSDPQNTGLSEGADEGADAALASIREILTGESSRRSATDLASLEAHIRRDMEAMERRIVERLDSSQTQMLAGTEQLRSSVQLLERDLRAAIERLGDEKADRRSLARVLTTLAGELDENAAEHS